MFNLKECIGKDGIGRMEVWVSYDLDKNKLACGESMCLKNNYKNNSYKINKLIFGNGIIVDIKNITSGKGETLSDGEFRKWLISNNYKDAFNEFYKKQRSC